MSSPLLTFEDVTIYASDLECLGSGQWLNDQIISFAMARFESRVRETEVPLRFLDASLVSITMITQIMQHRCDLITVSRFHA